MLKKYEKGAVKVLNIKHFHFFQDTSLSLSQPGIMIFICCIMVLLQAHRYSLGKWSLSLWRLRETQPIGLLLPFLAKSQPCVQWRGEDGQLSQTFPVLLLQPTAAWWPWRILQPPCAQMCQVSRSKVSDLIELLCSLWHWQLRVGTTITTPCPKLPWDILIWYQSCLGSWDQDSEPQQSFGADEEGKTGKAQGVKARGASRGELVLGRWQETRGEILHELRHQLP